MAGSGTIGSSKGFLIFAKDRKGHDPAKEVARRRILWNRSIFPIESVNSGLVHGSA